MSVQPADHWYVALRGKPLGPYSFAALTEAVANGVVTADTNVWRPPWVSWHPARTVPGLIEGPQDVEDHPKDEEVSSPERAVEQSYAVALKQWRMPRRLLAGFLATIAFNVFYLVWCKANGTQPDRSAANITGTLLLAIPVIDALRTTGRSDLRSILFGNIATWRRMLSISLIAPLISVVLVLSALAAIYASGIHLMQGSTERLLAKSLTDAPVTTLFLGVCVAPVYEEIAMQGWLQTKLQNRGPVVAVIATTIVFTLLHIGYGQFYVKAPSLLVFAVVRQKTGSLLCCILSHAVLNLSALGIWLLLLRALS